MVDSLPAGPVPPRPPARAALLASRLRLRPSLYSGHTHAGSRVDSERTGCQCLKRDAYLLVWTPREVGASRRHAGAMS